MARAIPYNMYGLLDFLEHLDRYNEFQLWVEAERVRLIDLYNSFERRFIREQGSVSFQCYKMAPVTRSKKKNLQPDEQAVVQTRDSETKEQAVVQAKDPMTERKVLVQTRDPETEELAVVQTLALQGWRSEELAKIYKFGDGTIEPAQIPSPLAKIETLFPTSGPAHIPPSLNSFDDLGTKGSLNQSESLWSIWKIFFQNQAVFRMRILEDKEKSHNGYFGVLEGPELIKKKTPKVPVTKKTRKAPPRKKPSKAPTVAEKSVHSCEMDHSVFPELWKWPANHHHYDLPLCHPLTAVPRPNETARLMIANERLNVRCGLQDADGASGYFIINRGEGQLRINGRRFGAKVIAGPLPGFAVIEVERLAMFWWQAPSAMDYTGEKKRKLNVADDSTTFARERKKAKVDKKIGASSTESIANNIAPSSVVPPTPAPPVGIASKSQHQPNSPKSNPSTPPPASLESTNIITWVARLSQGLALHRTQKKNRTENPENIKTSSGLRHDQVILAVGSMWLALRRQGTIYAYGETDVLTGMPGYSSVIGRASNFMMPLFVHDRNKVQKKSSKKGKKTTKSDEEINGHILFAVAELTQSKADKLPTDNREVNLRIYDSCTGLFRNDEPHKEARRVVCKCGWLPDDLLGRRESAIRFNMSDISVPRQEGTNSCGVATILNAWAVMLGIPIQPAPQRRYARKRNFPDRALEIINLALAGCMDSETIQAFMNVYGYSTAQDPNDDTQAVQHVTAEWMSLPRLVQVMLGERRLDEWHANGNPDPDEAVIQNLLNLYSSDSSEEFRRQKVIRAYIMEDRNINNAANRLMDGS